MKTVIYLVSVGFFIIFMSCTLEQAVDRREDKLMGKWEINKVIYDKYGGWFKKKVTRDYKNDEFEFLPDHRVYYYDEDIGVEFEGNWEIVPGRSFDHDGDEQYDFYIEMYFYDPVHRDAFGYNGYISRLTRNKFNFFVSDARGELEFRFRRK